MENQTVYEYCRHYTITYLLFEQYFNYLSEEQIQYINIARVGVENSNKTYDFSCFTRLLICITWELKFYMIIKTNKKRVYKSKALPLRWNSAEQMSMG